MNRRAACVLGLAVLSILAVACLRRPVGSLESLTRASHIIFIGRVQKLRAANLKVVTPTEKTAVVHIEDLIDAPPSLVGLKGQDVTVELVRSGEVRPQERMTFFTTGVLFGEHLLVKEIGLLPAPADSTKLRAEISAVRARMSEETLRARLASAVLVITGKVLETKPLGRSGPISEHEPDWAAAVVEVESVEKGSFAGRNITVYFPQSTDERWLLSPKFHQSQQGIWILRREENLGLPPGTVSALNPLDFRPLAEKDMIRRLLR